MMLLLKLLMVVLLLEHVPKGEAKILRVFKEAFQKDLKLNKTPKKAEERLVLSAAAKANDYKREVSFKKTTWIPKFGAKKVKKGKLQPKKGLSAYFLYQKDQLPKLRAASAEMTHMEAIKKTAAAWKTLNDAERKPFVDKGTEEVNKYEAAKK